MWHDLYANAVTKRLLDSYLVAPKHGLLLTGVTGSGLGTLAKTLANEIVDHKTDISIVEPDEKGTISIESVRSLYVTTRNTRSSCQVIVVDDLDAMSQDAQNAFLKLLEEPNDTVYFILTSHHPETLLHTITSRVEHIGVLPIDQTDSQSLLRSSHVSDAKKLQQLLFIAGGLPAELSRLANNDSYFEDRASVVRLARDFLSSKPYERLVVVSKLASREDALTFINILAHLIEIMGKKEPTLLDTSFIDALELTATRLTHNGHVRTQLANLSLHV